jgi:hypothetical protein
LRFFPVIWGILNNFLSFLKTFQSIRGFWGHLQRNVGFNWKYEAFLKITRLFEDILNGIEDFFKVMWGFFKESEVFLNYFQSQTCGVFSVPWNIEAFSIHFKRSGRFYKENEVFEDNSRKIEAFVCRTFIKISILFQKLLE